MEQLISVQEFNATYCTREDVYEDWVPLDFGFEDGSFRLVMVVQHDIQDAFLLKPRLRDFIKVEVEQETDDFETMMSYLHGAQAAVNRYMLKCVGKCLENGTEEGFA